MHVGGARDTLIAELLLVVNDFLARDILVAIYNTGRDTIGLGSNREHRLQRMITPLRARCSSRNYAEFETDRTRSDRCAWASTNVLRVCFRKRVTKSFSKFRAKLNSALAGDLDSRFSHGGI